MADFVEIVKNAAETLRVERTEYMGKQLVAVRVYWGRPGEKDARPSHKGLTLRPATWAELLPAIQAALEEDGNHGQGHDAGSKDTEELGE